MSQEKEAHIKFYKTREEKEIEKVIALENKVKALDDIIYKTSQSVQTMNMLNHNCITSFVKPEFLKKAQRANPRLYDIGFYNDNIALMLSPESDETIRLAQESRSKLSDLIRPFDYKNLNNLYDLFVPQHEKSSEQRYFSEREYHYADHMNAILGVYTTLDEFTDLQCDYVDQVVKCEHLEKELSKSNTTSNSFEALQKHAINLELALQQYMKAQLQDKCIAISELKKLIEKMKGKSVETKFEKSSVIRQPNAFKSQRQSVLGKLAIFSNSLAKTDFSKSKSVTKNNVSNDFSKPVTAQILPQNMKSILKNTNVIASGMYKVHIKPNQTRTPQLPQDLGKLTNVEGMNPNLFFVGQLCDADLEVAFRKSTCYIRDLKGNDLLKGSRGTDLYSITLQDTSTPNTICLMAKASSSQAWLWHRCLSHLNFNSINLLSKNDIVIGLPKLKFVKDHLCSSCELGKAKRKSFHTKTTPSSKRRLQLLHMDLCGPMRVESINGKKYVLVIVDDYSRYTWTHFLRSKDETPKVLIDFLKLVQRGLCVQVRTVRTDKGTKFLNKTLHAYFTQEGVKHQMSIARTPDQNGIVERRNRTLVEAARTMLSATKVPMYFWAEVIATTCFTQNRSLIIPRHEKTPYHIINGRMPSVKFFYIFCSLCYIIRDGENLDRMKEKCDACIFVGYSTQSRAYRVYNKRTKVIVKTIHVNFDELPLMGPDHVTSDPVPQSKTVTTSNELDLLFSLMFDELLNGTTTVVSKSSAVTTANALNQRQQQHTTPSSSITVVADTPPLNI
ncbi:retrovirus-related pol polyprotein from transposon TNT 1-94 [Tanacetum coccineum]